MSFVQTHLSASPYSYIRSFTQQPFWCKALLLICISPQWYRHFINSAKLQFLSDQTLQKQWQILLSVATEKVECFEWKRNRQGMFYNTPTVNLGAGLWLVWMEFLSHLGQWFSNLSMLNNALEGVFREGNASPSFWLRKSEAGPGNLLY